MIFLSLLAMLTAQVQQTGTVTLHVFDSEGKPIVHRQIDISQSEDDAPIRTYGFFRANTYRKILFEATGTTDSLGNVRFQVPRNMRFAVTTDMGFFAPVTLYGVVWPNKSANVVLRSHSGIAGRVVSSNGKGVRGVAIQLMDTLEGHMSGYPGTVIKTAVTDRRGAYRFDNLPPCTFNLKCDEATVRLPVAIATRRDSGAWEPLWVQYSDQDGGGESGRTVWMKHQTETCDFRLSKPGTITVDLANPWHVPLHNLSISVGDSGFELDYKYKLFFPLPSGVYKVRLERGYPSIRNRVMAVVRLREGQNVHVKVSLPRDIPGDMKREP